MRFVTALLVSVCVMFLAACGGGSGTSGGGGTTGTGGKNALSRLVLGSVATSVVNRAHCAVTVAR